MDSHHIKLPQMVLYRWVTSYNFQVNFVFVVAREHNRSVVEYIIRDRGLRIRALPASLRCLLEQDTLIIALKVLVQPRKTRSDIT